MNAIQRFQWECKISKTRNVISCRFDSQEDPYSIQLLSDLVERKHSLWQPPMKMCLLPILRENILQL
ncbi:hypothetical protein CMV_007321 [Castanea mollissima]|uniref:Uncharacterized protein n=1 Tax=Castanea mollissima TaxID=60419 RepID=A0A8J4VQC0_9ROSI|nr:hypothetical protein CMV_007321 [Castanea mollissima]